MRDNDSSWGGGCKHVNFVVDCEPLAELVAGWAVWKGDTLQPLWVRIGGFLEQIVRKGWKPRDLVEPLVEWTPREYNAEADRIANVVMNEIADVEETYHDTVRTSILEGCN